MGRVITAVGSNGVRVVVRGGTVRPGDPVEVELPDGPHRPLEFG